MCIFFILSWNIIIKLPLNYTTLKDLEKKNYAGTVGMNLLEYESHYNHIMLALSTIL